MIPIAALSLLLGLFFDLLFYGKIPGISVFIYSVLVLGSTFYLAALFRSRLNPATYGLAPVILFFSFMVFVRANAFLTVVNIFLVLYLLLKVARLAQQPDVKLSQYDVPHYFNYVGSLPIRFLEEFFGAVRRAVNNRKTTVQRSSYASILRGLLFSVPILIIFLILLSSADLVFKNMSAHYLTPACPVKLFSDGGL